MKSVEKSTPPKLRWQHREFDGEGHMSAPLLINYYALKFIFAEMQLPEEVWTSYNDSTFLGYENAMIKKYGKAARQSQTVYVPLVVHFRKGVT